MSRATRSTRLDRYHTSLTVISADSSCTEAGARPFARPRARCEGDIAAGDRTAFVVEDAQPRDSSPGTPVERQQRLATFAVDPAIAPLPQRRHQRRQVLPHRRQLVLVARAVDAGVDPGEHAVRHQVLQPRAQDVLRDVEIRLEISEAARTHERLAHHQKRPPVAQLLQRLRDRAVLILKSSSHGGEYGCMTRPDYLLWHLRRD